MGNRHVEEAELDDEHLKPTKIKFTDVALVQQLHVDILDHSHNLIVGRQVKLFVVLQELDQLD